mmetsp:Transcript_16525/g.23348  ORF Transcript_16525/g.23348 Transcript_16525/m.23348 type:complete len:324 (+) Transcript_16525:140-1111(+)|eukprot:CAMPEP_0171470914 /NCGR_PEP_ID=MMETSP0946-20130122/408_1 /TAXON_ID=109269 /ORGANISM="Vaucheria litorea, Strain CCMP2940" /LENGTH=323 /DNA_ID=CAMNT_0012000335 /DNA_START=185 /DNA_END=1156 /DNA_ORIENTATION=-
MLSSFAKCEADIIKLIKGGSLYKSTKERSPEEYVKLGKKLVESSHPSQSESLSPHELSTIYTLYLPVLFWALDQVSADSCRVIGINAPQGSGKTTLTRNLVKLFELLQLKAVAISFDDFYLTGEELDRVAKNHRENELLQARGNAGTHDLNLAIDTLIALKHSNGRRILKVPRFDKSLRDGKGDRMNESDWMAIEGKVDVILMEGWMLGFSPFENSAVQCHNPSIEEVNFYLKEYIVIDEIIDAWIVMKVDEIAWVYEWRDEAEKKMIENGFCGMSEEKVRDFVGLFMPAYKVYLESLYKFGPNGAKEKPLLSINIGKSRLPI